MNKIVLSLLLLLANNIAFTQNNISDNASKFQIKISRTDQPIKVDGLLNEAIWQTAEVASGFQMHVPLDNQPATTDTRVQLAYNDKFLYVAAVCLDDANYVIQTLKRDNFGSSDEFAIFLDPVNRKTSGYGFGVNALGAQSEALVFEGDVDASWDNKWYSAVQQQTDGWAVEMAIPFKSLRFDAGNKEWGINFVRIEPGANEESTWAPIPRQFEFVDFNYFGTLIWDKEPNKVKTNISLIPYASGSYLQEAGQDTAFADIGGDAKIGITPTLNLDLTVNPDFSQVEVDRQVTNLTRFNIFFPERRNFFLENADIFNDYGVFGLQPFYSRRIGLNESGQTVPITYGARLTGNLTKNWRIGAFNMHQRGNSDGDLSQNFTAATISRRVFKRSLVKGIFLNRQAYLDGELQEGNYGRNLGGEFSYSTPNGKFRGRTGYIQSIKEGYNNKNAHLYGFFSYDGQNFRTFFFAQHMPENYFSDMGFVGRQINFDPQTNSIVRLGFTQIGNMLNYYYYPKESKKINFHWSGIENFGYFNTDGSINEWYLRLRHFFFYKNTSQLRFRINYNYVNLPFDFLLTNPALPAKEYHMQEFNIQYNSDTRKVFNWELFSVFGSFYDGWKFTNRFGISYRQQPWGNFTIGLEQNNIWWTTEAYSDYPNLDISLFTFRAEINFSKNLFWTTFLQYNTQADNFNVNSRFQWRFAPMSDVFLVYTDNYAVEGILGNKNRSIVLRVNYWLTL